MSQSPVPPTSDPSAFVYVPPIIPPAGSPGPPPPKPPAWPMVIAVISIVLGGLGVAGEIFGLLWQAFMMPVLQRMPRAPGAPDMTFGMDSVWGYLLTGARLLTSAVLLIAGIALLHRRLAARALHLVYVMLKVGVALGSIAFMVVGLQQASQALATMPATSGPAVPANFIKTGMIAGGIAGGFGLVASMAYPVFLLVWFLRRRTIDDMRAWGPRQ